MSHYIYLAGDRDILIDNDGWFDGKNAGHVLRIAGLTIEQLEMHPSRNPENCHVLIRVDRPLHILERIALALACGSDCNREALALNGVSRGQKHPMLILSDCKWKHLTPVSICECEKRPCRHVLAVQPKFRPLRRPFTPNAESV